MPDPLALLADRLDPVPVEVFALLGYEPTPRQAVFHRAAEYDVLYGGAAGGGKTKALLMEGLRACIRWPGIRVGAFRRTLDEIEESFGRELELIDYASALGGRWQASKHQLRFPNRSVIRFRYLETVADATRRQGGEYQLVLIDERTLIPPAAVSMLVDERIRTGRTGVPVLGVRSGTNPGGVGHAACKARYIDATAHGKAVATDGQGRTVRFVQAKVADNPHVNAEYERILDGIADPARRRAMRDGDWDYAFGMFEVWRRERHTFEPVSLPPAWPRYAGIDWGHAAPWAVVWLAIDEDGRAWAYREHYETRVGEHDQARRILAAEATACPHVEAPEGHDHESDDREPVAARAADPSMWASRGDAESIASAYEAEGCAIEPANNDRVNGWQRIHTYLAEGPACRMHREMGWETCPMLHVSTACAHLIRTLPALPRDPRKPEDADTTAEDHAPDALRYAVMSIGTAPEFHWPAEPDPAEPGRIGPYATSMHHGGPSGWE